MRLTHTELNNCIEAMKTAVGNDKSGMSNIVLLIKPTDGILQCVGITSNYQVVRTVQPQFSDADSSMEILVNFKRLSELVSLSKDSSGIESDIEITFDTGRKELVYGITKYTARSGYESAIAERQLLSKIKHRIEYTYVSEDKRNGGLDTISIDWLMKLKNDSAENKDTCAWELNNFINTMSKMTAGDAGQVIMSNQAQAVATCNSNYAVYKEDKSASMSIVFQNSILNKIISILRTLKTSSKEEKLIVLHKYDSRLAIFDEEHSFIVQTDIPLARKLMLNHITGFNSADYSHAGAVLRKDVFIDIIKCYETLTDSVQANLRITLEGEEQYLRLEVPNSSSRQNDMMLKIINMREDIDVVNKPFAITLSMLLQMLNTCDTKTVCLSIALPEVLNPDEVPAGTAENAAQPLLKIASILDNNTEGLKCYSILG